MRKPRLVPEWRRAYQWATAQIGAALLLFGGLDQATQTAVIAWCLDLLHIPPERLPAVLGAAIIVGRMLTVRRG